MATKPKAEAPLQLFEMLVSKVNGHETVHRVQAADAEAASAAVAEGLPHGQSVIEAALAGRGVGSRR